MMFLAHSEKSEKCIPVQGYADHVSGTVSRAFNAAEVAASFSVLDGDLLIDTVHHAAEYHDLGKLDEENQAVLSGKKKVKRLPVQHTDAGTAQLLVENKALPAALVKSHHIGLPDFVEESNKGDNFFRDDSVRKRVDETLIQLVKDHNQAVSGLAPKKNSDNELKGNPSLFFRIALSCLVDGDHTDTAVHYGEYPKAEKNVPLNSAERLAALDQYIAKLEDGDERSKFRGEMYEACRNSIVESDISSCDSPVGTGKTTAVMAHLLVQADKRSLRRIIVVLPFINIITQSVKVYRDALVLPGENPEDVVAELHHRADFQDVESRHLTALWKAPIIVTTAVAFFETLASNSPATLRRLHNFPGSAIFVDESHAALPVKLLPLAWQWMKYYAKEWSCYWVLASGSLNRFWQIPEFDQNFPIVPEIVPDVLREKLLSSERERVQYRYHKEHLDSDSLINFVSALPGPRIVILNTVQSAAVAALAYKNKFGRESVEHLSTALCPSDRDKVLDRIKLRLENLDDKNWTVFATSCIESGVDFSFRSGVREMGSLVSLLQISGRVNRQGSVKDEDAEVWTICLLEGCLFKLNPGLKESIQVLKEYCEAQTPIVPSLCTEALKREVRLVGKFSSALSEKEKQMRFPQVEKEFRVISNDTRLVVVDDNLVQRLEKYEKVDWREIQKGSVRIWGYRLEALRIPEIITRTGIYKWNLEYDNFIGYMAGVLKVESFVNFMDGANIV
ncbi:MAG: CRISPR-associated protein [Candidatus Omnitrophica bacterium]|nr:CRISPR-associated protein [Candidatus Omnitrophota bacterium]